MKNTVSQRGRDARRKQYAGLLKKAEAGEHLSVSELTSMAKLEKEFAGDQPGDDEVFAKVKDVAEYVKCSKRTVYNAINSGKLHRQEDGSFLLTSVAAWQAEKNNDLSLPGAGNEEIDPNEPINKKNAETHYRYYRAEKEKINVQRLLGELLPRDEVERLVLDRVLQFKNALLMFNRRCSHTIAAESGVDSKVVDKIMDDEAKKVLKALSRRMDIHVD